MTSRHGFDATLDGRDVCIEFDRRTTWSTDHHYGADADGNRGISVTEIDEDSAENVTVFWYDVVDGAKIDQLENLTDAQQKNVNAQIETWLETNDPDGAADDYEPDYDDQDD